MAVAAGEIVMRKLCIGLVSSEPEFTSLLEIIGVDFEILSGESFTIANYSAIILNTRAPGEWMGRLSDYMNSGGIIIDVYGRHFFENGAIRNIKKDFLYNFSAGFTSNSFITLYSKVFLLAGGSHFEGAIHIKSSGKGCVAFWGIPLSLLWDKRYKRKKFTGVEHASYPEELASAVDKGGIMQAFEEVLIKTHEMVNMPFVRKSLSPFEAKSVFLFRVDTDYSDREHILKLYQLAEAYKLRLSWFLHTGAHEEWISLFSEFEGQEIAIHGHHHGISKSIVKLKENIESSRHIVSNIGIQNPGFCAPYGIYSRELESVLLDLAPPYSSEFTFCYDSPPLFPSAESGAEGVLQIPIHPVCPGTLSRSGYSSEMMKVYFSKIIEDKLKNDQPVLLYHHPMQEEYSVIEHIFKTISEANIPSVTFGSLSEFWKKRIQNPVSISLENGNFNIHSNDPSAQLDVYYNGKKGKSAAENLRDLTSVRNWKPMERKMEPCSLKTAKNLHAFSWKSLKISILDAFRRNTL